GAGVEGEEIAIEMTLTAQGCPSAGQITDQVKQRLLRMPGVADAQIELVWYPQWSPERLSPDARKELGID
ncbi:MAG TPA: metal-sulfur cluster assembly factor, partial [Candidatus Angelobacter sp.]|nr:metal-sulfur cluster assembly factor [Candidatus Angelobacter sp.]